MDNISFFLICSLLVLICIGLLLWSIINYKVAIFIVILSSLFNSISISNNSLNESLMEASIGSYIRVTVLLLMGIVGTINFLREKPYEYEKFPIFLSLLGIYIILAIISASYSIDQKYTTIRSVSFLALYGFLLGLHFYIKEIEQINQIINVLFFIICFILISIVFFFIISPETVWWFKSENRFRGLFIHPNTMGIFCMLSYLIFLWKFQHSKILIKVTIILFILIIAYFHLLTGSRGSVLSSIFGISIWLLTFKKRIKALLFIVIIFIVGISIASVDISTYQRYNFRENLDLSGRDKFWYSSYELIKERPFFGYGYGVAGKILEDPRFYNSDFDLWSGSARASLHNGYISVTVGLGVIGFLIWIFSILIPLWKCIKFFSNDHKALIMSVILSCMLINTIETTITSGNNFVSVVFWISIIFVGKIEVLSKEYEYSRNEQHHQFSKSYYKIQHSEIGLHRQINF